MEGVRSVDTHSMRAPRVFSSSAALHRVAVDQQLNIPGELSVFLVRFHHHRKAL